MAVKKAIANYSGALKELQDGDTLADAGISIGDAIGNSPIDNALLYTSGGNLANSVKLTFDGTDLNLSNPTAATVGSQSQPSPYLYFNGNTWDTTAGVSDSVGMRIHNGGKMQPGYYNDTNGTFEVGFKRGDGTWVTALQYGSYGTTALNTQLYMRSTFRSNWGGYIEVDNNGNFSFKKLNDDLSLMLIKAIGQPSSGNKYNSYWMNGSYNPEITAHFGGKITLGSGVPTWEDAGNPGYSADSYVQSNILFGIGVTTKPIAMLEVKNSIDDSHIIAILKQNTGSGTGDFLQFRTSSNTVLSKFKVDGNLEVPDEAYGSGWDGEVEVPTKNAVYDKIDSLTSADLSDFNEAVDDEVALLLASVNGTIELTYDDLDGSLGIDIAELDSGWSVTKTGTRKTVNSSTDTLSELADTVGTLIDLLKSEGILGA